MVQFNVPQKSYEFKPNSKLKDMCKCYEHTLVFYFSWNCCLDFFWNFCCQKVWITQASNLEITKKLWQHCREKNWDVRVFSSNGNTRSKYRTKSKLHHSGSFLGYESKTWTTPNMHTRFTGLDFSHVFLARASRPVLRDWGSIAKKVVLKYTLAGDYHDSSLLHC